MTDVVVVGGGVAGLCVAEGLARAGARVVCLEAATIGEGASGQCSGQLILGVIEAPHRVVASLGEARTRELYALTERSVAWLAERGLLDRRGQASVALDEREPAELERTAAVLGAMEIPAELHPPAAARERFGLDAGALLWTESGGRVRPDHALAGLAAAARGAGAEVVEKAPVVRMEEGPDGFVVQAGEVHVQTEMVVWTAGIGTRDLEPALREQIIPVREQAASYTGLPKGPSGGARAGFGYTWFERRGDVGWVGGCRWATQHLEVGETEAVPNSRVQDQIDTFASRLGWTDVGARWAWIEAHTRDGLPLVGPVPGSSRLLACTGFCGNDWGLGPGAAAAITEGLMGERSEASALFAPSRFL
ncbi:MAG: FAD-binding oxidoreductase [Myxococcota bacterium]